MTRNYATPRIDPDWALSRHTHQAVAIAIHAIASERRTPEEIWEAPAQGEWDHVAMAVNEYLAFGDFEPTENERYQWGAKAIDLKASNWII